jgi:hypothetical protein
MFHINL